MKTETILTVAHNDQQRNADEGDVREAHESHDRDPRQISALKRQLTEAEARVLRLQDELDHMNQSVEWRVIRRLRAVASRLPPSVQRFMFLSVQKSYRLLRYDAPSGLRTIAGPRAVDFLKRTLSGRREIALHYRKWVEQFDTITAHDRKEIADHIQQFSNRPVISVVMPVYETPEKVLREALDSLLKQIYPHWELCVADDASKQPHVREILQAYSRQDNRIKCTFRDSNGHISAASNSALALATGDYVALLDHDDVLAEHALYMVAEAILRHPTADVFYSDEDKLDVDGKRCDPHFKPDWSPTLFYGQNYLNHLTTYKRSAVTNVGGFRAGFEGSQDYDLALRVIAATAGPVIHIPYVLYHWRIFDGAGTMSSTNLRKATAAARKALAEYFSGFGTVVAIEPVLGSFNRIVRPAPAAWPKISVIIPTRDYLDVLKVTIDGLEHRTDYPNLEIIVADNESSERETLSYLSQLKERGIQVVACDGAFNYSDINNRAVAASTGDYVLLLNNDISMIEAGWLKEMMQYFAEPEVGVVGAKLLYPDGTLQHAGVVLGIGGVAGHRYARYPGNEQGTFGRLALAQDIGAVTGACLLVRRTIFDDVGGLDAVNLAVAFNDIDLCMRVRAAGYRVVWTPFAILEHHESKSRGSDLTGAKADRFRLEMRFMRAKWGSQLLCDPFFNPNLALDTVTPALASPPRLQKPWKTTARD